MVIFFVTNDFFLCRILYEPEEQTLSSLQLLLHAVDILHHRVLYSNSLVVFSHLGSLSDKHYIELVVGYAKRITKRMWNK